MATLFLGRLRQRFLPRGCRLSALFSNCRLSLLVPLISLVGYGLCLRGGRLLTLLLCLQHASAAFLLVLQAGKSGLTFCCREVWQVSRVWRRQRQSHRKMIRAATVCRAWAARWRLAASLLRMRRRRIASWGSRASRSSRRH